MKLVKIQFPGASNSYTYKTDFTVYPKDMVVVNTPSNGMQVVKVIAVEATTPEEVEAKFDFEIKWLVAVLDLTEYRKLTKKPGAKRL